MMSPLKGKSTVSPGASLCRTVLAERRPACLRRSTRPSIGFDSPNGSLSESKSLANLRFLSGSARQLLLRYCQKLADTRGPLQRTLTSTAGGQELPQAPHLPCLI